jgi:hypothetical protein
MKDIESFQADNRNSDVVAIEINNLTKRFGNFTAIDGLTLTVKYGEILVCLARMDPERLQQLMLSAVCRNLPPGKS